MKTGRPIIDPWMPGEERQAAHRSGDAEWREAGRSSIRGCGLERGRPIIDPGMPSGERQPDHRSELQSEERQADHRSEDAW